VSVPSDTIKDSGNHGVGDSGQMGASGSVPDAPVVDPGNHGVRDRGLAGARCLKCSRMLRAGQGIRCECCGRVMHVTCARLGSRMRAEAVRHHWTCDTCKEEKGRENQARTEVERQKMVTSSSDTEARAMKVMHWNCGFLASIVDDLEDFLDRHHIDVAMLQETKMLQGDTVPPFRDFNIVRKDRQRRFLKGQGRGGGLVTLIRKGIPYQEVSSPQVTEESRLEVLCVQVGLGRGEETLHLANVYWPPVSCTQGTRTHPAMELVGLPYGEKWLVMGDLNAHHELWDNLITRDERGVALGGWIGDHDMMVLNDGEVTRRHSGTGRPSTPDVSMCHESMAAGICWRVMTELGSDHVPIVVETNCAASTAKLTP
jgi:hypothetical protein